MSFEQPGNVLPAMTTALIQSGRFAQRSDDFLPRPFGGADRADQSPIFVSPTVGNAAISAQKHDWIMPQGCAALQPAVLHYRALPGFNPQAPREKPGVARRRTSKKVVPPRLLTNLG